MNPNKPDKEDQWHLDKKVPLSLIFAMLVQAAMVIWAIADIKKDVEVLKAAMGQEFSSAYLKLKRGEWNAYAAHFTEWERVNTLDI